MSGLVFDRDDRPRPARDRFVASHGRSLPPGFVLVAGRSEITRVVVGRIVERAGFRAVSALPEDAAALICDPRLGLAVLDGGAGQGDCDGLVAQAEAARRGGGHARIVFLSNRNATAASLGLAPVVEAVVSKPITPERLQPALERILGRAR